MVSRYVWTISSSDNGRATLLLTRNTALTPRFFPGVSQPVPKQVRQHDMNALLFTTAAALGVALIGASVLSAQTPGLFPAQPAPVWESCEEMHDTYVARFESAEGFGLSRMLRPAMLDREGVLEM